MGFNSGLKGLNGLYNSILKNSESKATDGKIKFDFHVTVHRDKLLTIKPTRCTNLSNLFLE
jgi:hypothetical protein